MASMRYDPILKEPYIQLPHTPELRLTPRRKDDIQDMVALCGHPDVGKYSKRRPYPYTEKDAESFMVHLKPNHDRTVELLRIYVTENSGIKPLGDLPLTALRYRPDPNIPSSLEGLNLRPGQLVGNLHIFPGISNDQPESGHDIPARDQTWEIAYDILPLLQGRGIGYETVSLGIESWIKWLDIGKVVAHVQSDNVPSSKLLQKLGFREEKRMMVKWPEEKGGEERELVRWALKC